jgi:hypothetical protein
MVDITRMYENMEKAYLSEGYVVDRELLDDIKNSVLEVTIQQLGDKLNVSLSF